MQRVFEYRLRPNTKQEKALSSVLFESRKAYNNALAEWKQHFEQTNKYLSQYEQDRGYNKTTYPNVPSVVMDQVLKRLHKSLTAFFKRRKEGDVKSGFPRFKSADRWNSIEYRDATNTLNQEKKLFGAGKLCGGKIKVVLHRPLEGKLVLSRIVKRSSGWYLQCVTLVEPKLLPETGKEIGLDMGCTYLVADSDGNITDNPKYYRKSLKKLGEAQRKLSACKKGSNRRKKAKHVVARLHERIKNQRKDTLHKISRRYVNKFDVIVIEDLSPSKMVRLPYLAMSILDSGWATLRQYLEYKAEEAGRKVVVVNPRYTSQKCSNCGEHVQKALSVRTHVCPHCGYTADRDVNAAKNILRAGARPSGNREAHEI